MESSHNVRMGVWAEAFNEYRRKNCDDKGTSTKKNLIVGQQIALKSLSRKIARLELLSRLTRQWLKITSPRTGLQM